MSVRRSDPGPDGEAQVIGLRCGRCPRRLAPMAASDASSSGQPTEPGLSVFISYRREGTGAEAGRLADALIARFGEERVFLDIDNIPLGVDFTAEIARMVGACDVLLAVIGRNWLTIPNDDGERRLDDPDDFVRLEIEAALAREIPVVPVLVQKTRMPRASELPESLGPLARRNGIELRDEAWRSDVQRFIDRLNERASSVVPAVVRQPSSPLNESGRQSGPRPGSPSATLALVQTLAVGFDSADMTKRVETAKQITGLAPDLELADVIGLCKAPKASERTAGAVALGVHMHSSPAAAHFPQVQSVLRDLLGDTSSLVRYRAAEVFLKSPALVPAYKRELDRLARLDDNEQVRTMAAKSL
jgi:TIR domain